MANKPKLKAVEEVATETEETISSLTAEETVAETEDTVSPPTTEETPPPAISEATEAELDAEEQEFRALRCDLPGVKGAGTAGIVTISVGKAPNKNEYVRSLRDFCCIIPLVDIEVGMDKQYFAVAPGMTEPLAGIGISVTKHRLYLTVTSAGAVRIVPVALAEGDSEQNEYHRTKEIGLIQSFDAWVRLYTDKANRCYKAFPAPVGRFGAPQFPDLKQSKIIKLAFRDKGRLIDSVEHPLFQKWAGRDSD